MQSKLMQIARCMDYSDRFRAQFSFKCPKTEEYCATLYNIFSLPGAVYIVAIDLLIFDLCLCPVGVEEVAGTYPVYSVHHRVISLPFSRYRFPFAFLILQACHKQKLACSYETTATRQTSTMRLFLHETKREACPVTE